MVGIVDQILKLAMPIIVKVRMESVPMPSRAVHVKSRIFENALYGLFDQDGWEGEHIEKGRQRMMTSIAN